jgi:hypothetical protein
MSFPPGLAIGLAASIAATAVSGTGAAGRSSPAQPPPRIRPAPGWVQISRVLITAKPRRTASAASQTMVVTVTAPDAAALAPFAPFDSFTRLRPGGIIVWATTLGRGGSDGEFAPMPWPPRLARFRIDHAWEGQPAPNVQQRLIAGSVRGRHLDVRVYFATRRPGRRLLARAARELRQLRLPLP